MKEVDTEEKKKVEGKMGAGLYDSYLSIPLHLQTT
jgi:hypothetical protein